MGVGWAAQIVHEAAAQTTADFLPIDGEVIVNKIYCSVPIYTVREERLKEFCEVQA